MPSKFKTDCSPCVFNASEDKVDCLLHKYELFENRGLTEGNIVNTLCSSCRNSDWLKEEERGTLVVEKHLANVNGFARIKKEIADIFTLIIVDSELSSSVEFLKHTLSVRQLIDPKEIIYVYSGDVQLEDAAKVLEDYVRGSTTKYSVVKTYDKNQREKIDEAVKRSSGMYYTVVESGDILHSNAFQLILNKVEKELIRLIYVEPIHPTKLTGMVVHSKFHKLVNGNFQKEVEEKVKEAMDADENQKDAYWTWGQLWKE